MLAFSASVICLVVTRSSSAEESIQSVKHFHALLRAAPVEALQTANLDICRALETIVGSLYQEFVESTTLHQKMPLRPVRLDERDLLNSNVSPQISAVIVTVADLIHTLGKKKIWPELTSPLRWMVKPGVGSTLIRIATNVPRSSKPKGEGFDHLVRCLALSALQSLLQFETTKQEIVTGDHADELFGTLFDIMLSRIKWDISEDDLKGLIGSKKIYPHEDAYDILGCFPRSMFTTHLTTVMEEACRAGKDECFKLLEPLAWLTRMEDEDLNDAMLSVGVFAFFERVARLPLPKNVDGLDYVVECEKKGDALICFRNMLNIMSPAQIARYTTVDTMKLILKLRDDPELGSRVTRRASDAYDAFIGDTKEKRTDRRTDEDYRRLWVKVRPSNPVIAPTGQPTEAPELDTFATVPAVFEGVPPPDGHDDEPSATLN